MTFKNSEPKSNKCSDGWNGSIRRFIAKRLLRLGINGAKWAEALALRIDPSLADEGQR